MIHEYIKRDKGDITFREIINKESHRTNKLIYSWTGMHRLLRLIMTGPNGWESL